MPPSEFGTAADALLVRHGYQVPHATMPPPLASFYRAVAFLASRARGIADMAVQMHPWDSVQAAACELAAALVAAERQFADTRYAEVRSRWAVRKAQHPVKYWGYEFPEPLAASLWTARRVLRVLGKEPSPWAAPVTTKVSPFRMIVVAAPFRFPEEWEWYDEEVDDDGTSKCEIEITRELFRGRPAPWVVNGGPISEEDMQSYLGEWRDGARPPDPSPLVREAWQDLSAWADEWPNIPKGSDGAATTPAHATEGERAKRRRRASRAKLRPLTPLQTEATHLVGEHKGNVTAAAKAAGISRQAMKKRYDAAMRKLGRTAAKVATVPLPLDRRAQPSESRDARRN